MLALLGCASADKAPTRLTVLTYNVHHAQGTDQRIDLERIAGVIRASGAGLVALQEVDSGTKRSGGVDQAAELGRLTRMHVVYGPAMPFQGGLYGNAVLSRYPIASSRLVELPWTRGGQREPRVALSATVKLDSKVRMVTFISTHFDHTREPSDRLAQAEAMNDAWKDTEALGRSFGRLAILAGDFNCEAGSPPMDALARDWTLVSDPALPTCCGAAPKAKIDHVFVKPSESWRLIERRVIDEPVASDHRPVVVKLELR